MKKKFAALLDLLRLRASAFAEDRLHEEFCPLKGTPFCPQRGADKHVKLDVKPST